METERSRDEIEEQVNLAHDSIDQGSTRWPGMSYEDGVDATLRWITGDTDDAPMGEE